MSHPRVSPFALASLVAALAAPATSQIVFEPATTSPGGGYATRVVVGDIVEDGVPDALVSHFPFFGTDPVVMPGLGDGSFGPPQLVVLPNDLITVTALGDFDGDGHLDLVALGGNNDPANVSIFFGDGRGAFASPVFVNSMHESPADATVADFDEDGALDIAIYNSIAAFFIGGGITVRFGHGDGTFEPALLAEIFGFDMLGFPYPHSVRAGDVNGDGLPDLVFTATEPVLINQGDRTFELAPCESDCLALAGRDLALADVNGDGRADALTPTEVRLALPDGSLAAPLPLASGFVPMRVAAGDLEGDGLIDAVVSRNDIGDEYQPFSPSSTFGDVLLLRGLGDGSFQAPVVASHVPQTRGLAVADVDLDGRPDVLAARLVDHSQSLTTLLNHTYPAGSPFTDLGGALGGSNGYPIQLASGTLVAGQPFSFKLFHGPPSGVAFHIVGLAALDAPFKGGTLIPFPHLMNGPLPLNASGNITLAANWPAGGSGLTLWVQFWMPNGGGPAGFVASSGVRAQIP